jgi:ABC-type transporter Mla subunit MlaD
MRRIALIACLIAAGAAGAAGVAGADDTHTYKLEMYDAFGLVPDAEVKVAGVTAGSIKELDVNEDKRAVVTVELSGPLAVLGDETECSSEPQSLIAEYFIDCQPAGKPLPDGATVPNLVSQTVQNDLVLNTLRLPYRQRLSLLINEFGTALAGNPENLNEAIRMGAPALQDLHEALRLLAQQNRTIAQLNVDSDRIIGKLVERTDDVVRFVEEAGDTAVASAARRDDLSTDFDLLDDALRELGPTMAELENVAVETTPLLADLRRAAPGLNTLATNLPAFARAGERSLTTLGKAAKPGIAALKRGEDEIEGLAEAARSAPPVAEQAKLFLDDISDPRRAVAIDARVPADTGRDNPEAGQPDTRGYTGMEGLLNYFYYFGGALNQFDDNGHFLHFSLYDVFAGPCGTWNAEQHWPLKPGEVQNPATDAGIPAGRTVDPKRADPCVGMLGPNQPGITAGHQEEDLGIGRYPGAVCPQGSTDHSICDPGNPNAQFPDSALASAPTRRGGPGGPSRGADPGTTPDLPVDPGTPGAPGLPQSPEEIQDKLDEILDLPGKTLENLGLGGKGGKGGNGGGGGSGGGGGGGGLGGLGQGTNQAAEDLLDFLFGS